MSLAHLRSRPRGGRHASSMAQCAFSLRLSPYVPKNKTPSVSKLTSGCRPREVRHASSMARCALSLRLSPYVDSVKAASSSKLDSVAPAAESPTRRPPCQLDGAMRHLAAAIAVCPEKQNPSCEQAHVGVSSTRSPPCQPEDAAASSGCGCRRMSIQSKPPHQASLIRWLRLNRRMALS